MKHLQQISEVGQHKQALPVTGAVSIDGGLGAAALG
jgi:hypothetical protein